MAFITLFDELDYRFAETTNEHGRKIKVAYTEDMTISALFEKIRNDYDEVEKRNERLEEENRKKDEELEVAKNQIQEFESTIAEVLESNNPEQLVNVVEEWKFNPSTITNEEEKFSYEKGKLVKYNGAVYIVTNLVIPTEEQTPDVAINYYRVVSESEVNVKDWGEVSPPISTGTIVKENGIVYRYTGFAPGYFPPSEDQHSYENLGPVSEYRG